LGLFVAGTALAEPPIYKPLHLLSGQEIKLLSAGPVSFDNGVHQCLSIRYQTDQKYSAQESLFQEVDDIWDKFEPDANRANFNRVIITADFDPSASDNSGRAPGFYQCLSFVFERDANKEWHCINEKKIGAVTPAKAAYKEAFRLTKVGKYRSAIAEFDKSLS